MKNAMRGLAALCLSMAVSGPLAAQEKTAIAITRQPGILYLASHVMETQRLIEKRAEALGVKGVTVEWRTFSGGGAQTDALLAGSVDIVNTGTGNLLLLWDRTKGRVKGIVASSAQPVIMVSNDPRIKSLDDITPQDKIAVPTVGVSTQAILLQMAAAAKFGDAQVRKFDPNTVQLGHPDAVAAIANPVHEVKNHFSAPPYQYLELKQPGVHRVTDSREIIGGGLTQATFFTTTTFADKNPKLVAAVREATEEAIAFIRKDPKAALEAYKTVTGDKTSVDDLMAIMNEPGFIDDYRIDPQGTMRFAVHLNKIGTLKTLPKAWTDYYLPTSADLKGN